MKIGNSLYYIQLRSLDEDGDAIDISDYNNPEQALKDWIYSYSRSDEINIREYNLKTHDTWHYEECEFDMLPKKLQKILVKFQR